MILKVPRWLPLRRFLSDCCISSGMLAAGDAIQQVYELQIGRNQATFDTQRTGKMATAGATIGVYCHFLYRCLDRTLPGRDVRTLTKKVLLDNMAAPGQFAIFFGVLAAVEERSWIQYWSELRQKGLHLYLASSCIYIPAQFINFRFLKPHFRVLYVSLLNLSFDTYTSYVAHTDHGDDLAVQADDISCSAGKLLEKSDVKIKYKARESEQK